MDKQYNLLVESSSEIEMLTEDTDNGKQLYIEGIFAQSEVVNHNKRFYPKSIMEGSMNDYIENYVNRRRALGELNHPKYPMPDPDKAAIRITEMKWSGNDIYGKALVLNTPKGQTVRGLLEGGFNMGVSTRALGSLKEKNGINYVQSDLMFTAVDCVDDPSGPNCYVNSLIESTRWSINESGTWVPIIKENETAKINEELFLEKMEEFIKQIKV